MKRLFVLTALSAACSLSCGTDDAGVDAGTSNTQAAGRVSKTALTAHVLRIRKAAAIYRSVNGAYPDTAGQLVDAGHIHAGQDLDPWGTPFALNVEGSELVVTSYGADKQPGGEAENRDRVSRGTALR
jgi:hypothetical protein